MALIPDSLHCSSPLIPGTRCSQERYKQGVHTGSGQTEIERGDKNEIPGYLL